MADHQDIIHPNHVSWMRDLRGDASVEHQTLTFIYANMNANVAKLLHKECGQYSLHSLKLKAFMQMFNAHYLDTSWASLVAGHGSVDDLLVPTRRWTCRDVNGCLLDTIHRCSEQGWPLRTSQM